MPISPSNSTSSLAQRGVRHGQLNMVAVEIDRIRHVYPHDGSGAGHTHRHEHFRPKN
jgi:hypothetical protein